MRSDLKAVQGTSNIKTDLDEKTCSFEVANDVDVEELLDSLADKNNKMFEWSFQMSGPFARE